MANRLDNVLDGLETELAELVTAGDLRQVVRRLVNPAKEAEVPILGLLPSSCRAIGQGRWEATAIVRVCTRARNTSADASITDLMAQVVGKIREYNAKSNSNAGTADMPRFDLWYDVRISQAPVGAWGIVRISIGEDLLISE